ncbi:hypothetical protein PACTADRAFT_14159 [Pachysolen tannophilus NRRL Y-2460]|uniref:Nuclear control of ATPase protein 2 n=1 Tax=Pachysolen tannophilus NRRL Y-2460 TaxID=669874 RepID=A0A1E4U136_PACTA|nr:hypothetical protein PACTADRAFT_14159 [Pachysolen tannophilus NRRL Y-2460]
MSMNSIINHNIKSNLYLLDNYSHTLLSKINELDINSNSQIVAGNKGLGENLLEIQSAFYKIYSLSNGLLNKDDSGQPKKLKISLIVDILKPFNKGSIYESKIKPNLDTLDNDLQKQVKFVSTNLEKLIILYSLLLIYLVSSFQLLKSTIPLDSDLQYYNNLINSNVSFGIFLLQNLPVNLFSFTKNIYTDLINTSVVGTRAIATGAGTAVSQPPRWLSNNYHYLYYKLIQFKEILLSAIYKNFKKIVSPNLFLIDIKNHTSNTTKKTYSIFKNYLVTILGTPLYSIREEILNKRKNLINLQKKNAEKLGFLINELPTYKKFDYNNAASFGTIENVENEKTFEKASEIINKMYIVFEGANNDINIQFDINKLNVKTEAINLNESFQKLFKIAYESLPSQKISIEKIQLENGEPRFLIKYWFILLLSIAYLPSISSYFIVNHDKIKNWIRENLIGTVVGFYKNWLLKPFQNILATVKHDSNSQIAIMSQQSLNSDLQSLERMVIDFTIDQNRSSLSQADIKALEDLIAQGDLTPIMKNYETELKNPIRNLIKGELLRTLLIQIQKLKVDGAIAMSGIDKLLKSQELVFGVVAASPSLLVLYYALANFKNYLKNGYISKFSVGLKLEIRTSLNHVERLINLSMNSNDDSDDTDERNVYFEEGMLLLETVSLRYKGLNVLPIGMRDDWIRDLNDLNDKNLSLESRLNTVNRIWNVYGSYLD